MKKVLLILCTFFCMIVGLNASETFNSLNINVYLKEDGSANVTEVWDINVSEGTELYKTMENSVENFTVKDETGRLYEFTSYWDVNGSLSSKAYKNGINTTNTGIELCWGKSTYGKHVYTINYDVKDIIFNTSDAQVLYYTFVNDNMNPVPKNIKITVNSFYSFPDTLDVWGYGYKGLSYVHGGKAYYDTDSNGFYSDYRIVALMKFPKNVFSTTYTTKYSTFDEALEAAKEGSSVWHDSDEESLIDRIITIVTTVLVFLSVIVGAIFTKKGIFKHAEYNYGTKGKIKDSDVNAFRDIPCNKDLYRAYYLSDLYDFSSSKSDVIGSILLKWLLEDKIKVIQVPKKFLKKESVSVDLMDIKEFENTDEESLYIILKEASKDNILENNELKSYCKRNYNKLPNWIDSLVNNQKNKCITQSLLVNDTNKSMFSIKKYIITEKLREEAVELCGLKKFLIEFSRIKEKQPLEVKLWKEYLIFAQIFGIAKEVSTKFKELYPEVIEINNDVEFDNVFVMVNMAQAFSNTMVSVSESARLAENYHSGGGGFSSLGGGGGSFGGGSGGGSR